MTTAETPAESLIPYDEIVQEALRTVVKRVLSDIEAAGGLPGNHHFYVAFKTRHPGVEMPKHLMERYPDEMTVVVQHRYWDLAVGEEKFQIGLSFNQVPAKLVIPYAAIVGFVDPQVEFQLQILPRGMEGVSPALRAVADAEESAEGASEPAAPGSNVVTLDKFRKK